LLLSVASLLFFLLCRQRRVHFQQALRQAHPKPLASDINALQKSLGKRYFVLPTAPDYDQQRRFSSAKTNIVDDSNFTLTVEDGASDEVAHVIPTCVELRAILFRDLQLGAY